MIWRRTPDRIEACSGPRTYTIREAAFDLYALHVTEGECDVGHDESLGEYVTEGVAKLVAERHEQARRCEERYALP